MGRTCGFFIVVALSASSTLVFKCYIYLNFSYFHLEINPPELYISSKYHLLKIHFKTVLWLTILLPVIYIISQT
jgi:hypothetical protein